MSNLTHLFKLVYPARIGALVFALWLLGSGTALAVYPAPWPSTWTPYTSLGASIIDPDSSTDGTYGVSATPSVVDYFGGTSGTLPTVYYAYDATNQVFFIRVRMRGDPFKTFGDAGPYDAYAWHIVFDISGDGYKDFVIVLDGMSGQKSNPYDDIEIYYGALARRQDFNSSPCASGGDQVWIHDATDGSSGDYDFAYTRRVDQTASGGGYLLDVQVPLSAMNDCSGNPIITARTPFMLVFTTSTQNNNPTQKDLVGAGTYTMSATAFLPLGDPMTLQGGITQSPFLTDLRCSCAGSTMTLTAYTLDTLAISGGNIVDTINNVTFYYWNGSWIQIGSPVTTPNPSTVNEWAVNWDTTGLSGTYPLRVVITDDQSNTTADEWRGADVTTCGITPLLATFKSLSARRFEGYVLVEWQTSSEVGTAGFYLYRENSLTGSYELVNEDMVPGLLHSPQGGVYQLIDKKSGIGDTLTYKLVEIDIYGQMHTYGPVVVHLENIEIASLTDEVRSLIAGEKESIYTRNVHRDLRPAKTAAHKKKSAVPSSRQGGDRIKVAVREPGMYFVSAEDIASSFGLTIDRVRFLIGNGKLRLASQGKKVPYHPAGENAGIYFYGKKIESNYTDENIYWLTVGKGKKMKVIHGVELPPGAPTQTFIETLHFEEDDLPAVALASDPNDDYWFWDYIVSSDPLLGSRTFSLRTDGATPTTQTATLIVYLHGVTETSASDRDHHAVVSLNGTAIGEGRWDGKNPTSLTLQFSQELLGDGDNLVEVKGEKEANVPYSFFYVDSFDVIYERYCRAVNNALKVPGLKNEVVTIEGFTQPEIFVYDISDPNHPKFMDAVIPEEVSGSYRVSFVPTHPKATYLAVAADAFKVPVLTSTTRSFRLKQQNEGADCLIITPEGLREKSLELASYRGRSGLTANIVTLEEIYDEFNHGIVSPEAIKGFLTHAYFHWKARPQYVVLIGKGTFDYKDVQGYGDNLLPPLMVSTPFGLFASDNYLADVVGNDGVPELAIGRLPVITEEELDTLIQKIMAYELAKDVSWRNRILMLADNPDDGGDFPADSDKVWDILPPGFLVEGVYLSDYPIEEAHQLLVDNIHEGVGFLNYIGHGGFDRLAHEGLLVTEDIESLTNATRLPLVSAMTCLANRFDVPGFPALGVKLVLHSGGGAVAVWGPTGLASEEDLLVLDKAFFKSVFVEREKTLGEAVLRALRTFHRNGGDVQAGLIYNLLGDPCLRLRLP